MHSIKANTCALNLPKLLTTLAATLLLLPATAACDGKAQSLAFDCFKSRWRQIG